MSFEAKKEHAIAIMESWPQDPTVAFCHVLANNLADGRLVWSGMGDLYVVFFMEGQWYAAGRCICLKHSRRYLLWCSYGCVSLVAKGS